MKRKYRCYCGETTLETTQVGDVPKCKGCSKCHSTLSGSKSMTEQRTAHDWKPVGDQEMCTKCGEFQINETPQVVYDSIFLKGDTWINNQGEEIDDISEYDIEGRYLRNGVFDKRDDIKSKKI